MSQPKENAVDKANRLGLLLVIPKDDELFVDIDTAGELERFHWRWDKFLKVCPTATKQYTKSVNGHWHVYVRVPDFKFTMDHRIALQAALGSDPMREMIATFHHIEKYEYPSVFFERHETVRTDTPHNDPIPFALL